MLAINIFAPAVMHAIVARAHEAPISMIAAAVGVALPGLAYVPLSCIWFLSLAQRMLLGLR